jgi:hypothetical protein
VTALPASGLMVRMRHVRQAGLCASGLRTWCAHFDRATLRTFCRDGLPIEWVESLDDAYAQQLAAIARAEAGHGR